MTVEVSGTGIKEICLDDARPILDDDITLSGNPSIPLTCPDVPTGKRHNRMMRRPRGITMSLPCLRKILQGLGIRRHLEIKHRVLSIHHDIGIDGSHKRGVLL